MDCEHCEYKLLDFTLLSGDNEMLHNFLRQHGVLNITEEFRCPKCNNPCTFRENRFRYECNSSRFIIRSRKRVRVKCNFTQAAKKNTIFGNSKKSISEICMFVAYWLHQFKQEDLESEMEWSSRTVVAWVNFCREVCFIVVSQNSERLGGEGKIVEIDEAKFGKKKYNRGRVIEGQWVFGGIERDSKKVFLVPVANRSHQDALLDIIKEWILPGTTIRSDCWRAYDCLNHEGFQHLTVNHRINFVDPVPGAHSRNVERMWRDLRNDIPRFGRREEHFVYHLAEYYFHKKFPAKKDRFHHFFKYIGEVYPPTVSPDDGDEF